MSFIDDVIDFGKSAVGWLTGSSLGSNIAKTALLGFGLNQLTKSVNKGNDSTNTQAQAIDPGVRLQVQPDANQKIPVLYGSAYFGGIITDAYLTADNKSMYYVLTLSEKTGIKTSDGLASTSTFNDIYINDQRLVLQNDGITAAYSVDRDGNIDYNVKDLVRVYCYDGNSEAPTSVEDYPPNNGLDMAYNIMPNWTSNHMMTNLVFAIVRIDYSKEKNLTSIPKITFHVTNSMSLPGDCLYDYMTNTRYGAGIAAEDIYVA